MIDQTPDLDSLIDGHLHGPERDRFERVLHVLVRAGPLPELPDTPARAPALALRRPPVARPAR